MSALLSLAYGTFWRLSWWDYHLYLLAGFAAAAWAVVAGYRGSRTLEGAVGGITVRDPLEQVAHGQPDALHALDRCRRGEGPVHARTLRPRGRAVHEDRAAPGAGTGCGARSAPGRVPARRGEDQRPRPGPEQAGRAGPGRVGADPAAPRDRLGSGEPRRLAPRGACRRSATTTNGGTAPATRIGSRGTDIPLSGRIVAVADVWDALTSDRAYRPAWDLDRAVSHLAAASGTLFDPACVEAFLDVVAEMGLVPERTRADLDALAGAAADCHPIERRPSRDGAPDRRSRPKR